MTILKNLEQQYLIEQMIDQSLSGNAGLAIVSMRKKMDLVSTSITRPLNEKLIEIELRAREEMRTEIKHAMSTLAVEEVLY